MGQAPFGQEGFRVTDQYQGPFNGQWISIYAGEEYGYSQGVPTGTEAGAIRVYRGPIDPSSSSESITYVGEFFAPNAPSWIVITRVSGSTVTLKRADGSTTTFNLVTDTFS